MIGAARLREISDSLAEPENMGPGGMEIDDWLAERGVVEFADFLFGEVRKAVAGMAAAGGDQADLLKGLLMHGFFIGLETGRQRALELQAPEKEAA